VAHKAEVEEGADGFGKRVQSPDEQLPVHSNIEVDSPKSFQTLTQNKYPVPSNITLQPNLRYGTV
jgi:hypothetical protein